MSKSLGNYVGVTDPPGGDVRQADADPRRGDGRVLPAAARRWSSTGGAADRGKARAGAAIVERFYGRAAAAAAEEHFDRLFVERGPPDEIEEFELTPIRRDGDPCICRA